jgi:hypothetical protein
MSVVLLAAAQGGSRNLRFLDCLAFDSTAAIAMVSSIILQGVSLLFVVNKGPARNREMTICGVVQVFLIILVYLSLS